LDILLFRDAAFTGERAWSQSVFPNGHAITGALRGLLNKSAELQLIGPLSAATVRHFTFPTTWICGPTRLVPLDQNGMQTCLYRIGFSLSSGETDTDDPQKDQINYRQYLPFGNRVPAHR